MRFATVVAAFLALSAGLAFSAPAPAFDKTTALPALPKTTALPTLLKTTAPSTSSSKTQCNSNSTHTPGNSSSLAIELQLDIKTVADIETKLIAALSAKAYAQIIDELQALVDISIKLGVLSRTASAPDVKSISDLRSKIVSIISAHSASYSDMLNDIGNNLKANSLDVIALLKIHVRFRGVLAASVRIGANTINGILSQLEAQLLVLAKAYIDFARVLSSGSCPSPGPLNIAINILAQLKLSIVDKDTVTNVQLTLAMLLKTAPHIGLPFGVSI